MNMNPTRLSALLAAAALTVAGCATPMSPQAAAVRTDTQRTAPQTVASNSSDPDQVICRQEEVTGSHMPARRVCHTQREWAQMTTDARQVTEKIQQSNGMRSPG